MKGVRINGQICFIRLEDAADYLNCSVQTIRRYTDHRQREERRMNMIHFEGDLFKGLPCGLYLPVDEAKRFRDEIRPTFRFGGRDGRKKGSKDKKPRKKPEQPKHTDPLDLILKYTPPSRKDDAIRAEINKILREHGM